jgi:hypothetical protein
MLSPKKIRLMMSVLTSAAALAACAETTGPNAGNDASVQGRVEETTPPASSPSATAPQRAAGGNAQTVAVVQIQADGSFMELATAEVDAGGSFTVEGVPAGRTELAVVAYGDGEAVGSALIHEQSRADVTITAAPINSETTLEARTYSRVRASAGGEGSTSSELALLMHADGSSVDAAATSEAEIEAAAAAYATASATMSAAYEMRGAALDASTRAEIVSDAAVDFAIRRYNGMSLTAAHDMFTEAALDALVDAGAELEATVVATAAAASTFDAGLEGGSSIRGELDVQPVRLNLLARERLAASFASTFESSVAVAIENVIADARASLSLGIALIDLRALIDSTLSAVIDAGADACVTLLAAGASSTVQAEVRAAAEAAFEAARLEARLHSATTAQAAVTAMASYRADVRAAVDTMIAASGSTSADAEVLTSLFIAASGGAYIR